MSVSWTCMKRSLSVVQASDHSQGLLLPEDLLGFKVRICKSNVVSQIVSVQMRLMTHLDTVFGPQKIICIYAVRQILEQSGRNTSSQIKLHILTLAN